MSDPFFDTIPAFTEFKDVVQKDRYRTLPEDWLIGVADVVDSTSALQAGRYKAVNTVGASVISAIMNLDRDASFPFVFGGDGAAFAVPESRHDAAADANAGLRKKSIFNCGPLWFRFATSLLQANRFASPDSRLHRVLPTQCFQAVASPGQMPQ